MKAYDVQDILANISAQCSGYNQDIETHGLRLITLVETIEFLVNETSKLKTVLLEVPNDEEIN